MAICGDASPWAKFGFLLMVVGLALFIGGFASFNWMVSETVREKTDLKIGLFNMKNCSDSSACTETIVYYGYENDIFKAAKYMECVVLVLFVGGTVMYGVYVAMTKARTRCMAISIIICNVIIALVSFVSMICWLVQVPSNFFPSFSLGLILLATVLVITAACLLVKEIKTNNFYTVKTVKPIPAGETNGFDISLTQSPSPTPRGAKRFWKQPITPSPPSTPSTITKFMLSEDRKSKTFRSSPPSYHSSSPRRYGTPKYVTRYDYKAR